MKLHRLLLCMLVMSTPLLAQQRITFSGRVSRGQSFVRPIGHGLVFEVRSENDDFTLSVARSASVGKAGGDNLARCVTPPFHGPNALEINGWELGNDRTRPELAEAKTRKFQFVMNEADQKKACQEMQAEVYGPAKQSSDGRIVGDKNYRAPRMGKGVLRIVNYELQAGGEGKAPEIRWMSFRGEIELPARAMGVAKAAKLSKSPN